MFAPTGYTDWKPLKLLDLEFANSIRPTESSHRIGECNYARIDFFALAAIGSASLTALKEISLAYL